MLHLGYHVEVFTTNKFMYVKLTTAKRVFILPVKVLLIVSTTAFTTCLDRICHEAFKGQLWRHEDCTKFYHCVSGRTMESECPDGLHLNFEKQTCEDEEVAGCAMTTTRMEANDYNDWYEEEAKKLCGSGQGDLLPHDYCNRYYRCSHGRPLVMHCGWRQLFDTMKRVCDSELVVQCDERFVDP